MLIVLVGFAVGALWGFKGGVIVVAKDGFANTLSQYDDFRAGAFFDPADLEPFDFTVNDFDVTFIREGREAGMAHKFAADLTYRPEPGAADQDRQISVNHPLDIDGTDVFLISHGYAPHITVRNADRSIAFSGPVVFLPEDSTFRSFGVVKVPDAGSKQDPTQIGLEGEFYPTYAFTKASGPFSAFPDDRNPAISMLAYRGRPRARHRYAAVGLRAAEEEPEADPHGRRQAAAPRPRDGPQRRPARRPGHGDLRRAQPLREAPGQPHAGQLVALGGVVLALLGTAGVAVHPSATDLGPDPAGGRAYARRGRRARPERRR